MSDNKDKPQSKTVSVYGFQAFGNPLDNNGEPIKHSKKQLPVKYYTRRIENDLGEGFKDLIQITAYTMQYDVVVSAAIPFDDTDLIYIVANAMVRAKLAAKGYHIDNIELVDADAGENDKQGDL